MALHGAKPNRKSQIINGKSLLADGFCRAGAHADAAIDAVVRIDFGLAVVHLDRTARTLRYARLTARALALIHYCRHPVTLSKTQILLEKTA